MWLFRRKKVEEKEDDDEEEGENLLEKIPTIRPSQYDSKKEHFQFPSILKYLEKDPYMIRCPSSGETPTQHFWKRSKLFRGFSTSPFSREPIYPPEEEIQKPVIENNKKKKIEEEEELDGEGEGTSNVIVLDQVVQKILDIRKLFHEAENGPLRIVLLYSTTDDVIFTLSKVSKLFNRISHFYLQNIYTPTISDFERYFSLDEPVGEIFCISLLLNKKSEKLRYTVRLPGGKKMNYLSFSLYHGYETMYYYLSNGSLEELGVENPLGGEYPRLGKKKIPDDDDYDIAATRFRPKLLGMMLRKEVEESKSLEEEEDDEEEEGIVVRRHITPSMIRCFLYSRDLENLEYMRKNFQVSIIPSFEIYSDKFFFEYFLLEYREENIRVLDYLRYQMRFNRLVEVEKERFLNYSQFMDKKMIEYLVFDEKDIYVLKNGEKKAMKRFTANNGDYFIQCIEANRKLSKEDKKELVDSLFFDDMRCPFPSAFRKGFEFAYFYGRNGYVEELLKALAKIDVPLDYPRKFDMSRFGDDPNIHKIVMVSPNVLPPLRTDDLVQFALTKYEYNYDNGEEDNEEPEEITEFFEKKYKKYREEDERTISVIVRMSINFSNNYLFRRLMRLEGYSLPLNVIEDTIRKMKSKELVKYLFRRYSEGLRQDNDPRNLRRNRGSHMRIEDLNPFFLDTTKMSSMTFASKYDFFADEFMSLIREGRFTPNYNSVIRAHHTQGKNYAEDMIREFQPLILGQVFEFVATCAYNEKKKWIVILMKRRFWRDAYLLFFFYERYKSKERAKFLELFPRYKRRFKVQCFNCGKDLYVFHNNDNEDGMMKYGEDFVRCQAGKGCSVSPRILKSHAKFWNEVRDIEKIFCKDCKRTIGNTHYCVVCAREIDS